APKAPPPSLVQGSQAKRLAAQKAQAKRKGQKGIKWGQMSGANSQNFQLPPFIQQLGAQENERSVLVVDSRDKRIRSPFQGWLLDEILLNAQCGINVLSDGKLIRSPNSGYHMNVFYVRTLDGFKFILVGCMTSYGTVPCAKWDAPTGAVMAHPAFQPFRWPMMTNESATWVDVKFKVEGELLLHLELRGYRSDEDMTVQMNYLNDALIRNMNSTLFIPSMVVTIFQGWRVIATSFEVGGRLYACSDGGVVVAMDYPLCHFEVRITATSSADSIGLDADRLEFRFRSAGDSVDVRCSQIMVPSTWLVVSRVSGPTLIKNARWCREHFARIEGPDQTMQLSQLAGIHAHWTAAVEAASIDETGPRIGEVAVNTHPANLHLTCESPLFRSELKIVPKTALALQAHDVEQEQSTAVLPPVTGAVGGAPGLGSGPFARSLETRRAEAMAPATVTPQAFLDHVDTAVSGYHHPAAAPKSFGPAPVVEEILALPVFSDDFAQAILASQYSNLALIAAMEVRSAPEFVVQVHEWEASLDPDARDIILGNGFMLEQYWSLASAIEKAYFASTANQLGFGLCDPVTVALSAEAAEARRKLAMKSLVSKPQQPPRKLLKKDSNDSSATPLLDQENAAKLKWSNKLEEIGKRAGVFSKLLQDTSNGEGLSAAETARLRQLVLSSGAPRTMAAHISAWERFEDWATAEGLCVFPLTHDKLLKYALALDQKECGPSVLPSFRTSVRWVTSKLAIECPDLAHPALLAVQSDITQKRATTLKEAVPFSIELVGCLEMFVCDKLEPAPARLFIWWWLCMVFASLRFDDAMHVKPMELLMSEEGLFGVAWQTKVERRRRGTKFVVPHVGFKESKWLEEGWNLFSSEDLERDYWMRELNTREEFKNSPASYQRSLQWLKFLAKYALNQKFEGPEVRLKELISTLSSLTAHSARVTLLDAAVHAGRSTEEIGLQANWKNPGPLVLKYTRNRTSVPAQMVRQLVKDMVEQEHPFEAPADAVLDEVDLCALDEVIFFVKTQGSRASHDYRYHCLQVDDDQVMACGRIRLEDCTEVGSTLPDVSVLCKHCARVRPEVASRCFSARRAWALSGHQSITMVDRTNYDIDKTPELPLRQILGRQRVPTELCKLAADSGLLTVETFAMLGDTIHAVKAALRTIVADNNRLGADAPAQELALTNLAAVWKTCSTMQDHFAARRAKMEEDPSKVPEIPGEDHAEFRDTFVARHPDVLLPLHREPHRKFVERVQRDYLVHGFVHFYEVGEIRTRNEQIAQKSGISKNAEDLLRVVMVDQPTSASSETQVMDKLHAFFITLEYLNICEFSFAAGPLKYLAELEEWRHENRGLALLLTVDTLIRKKVHRVSSDQRKKFTTFSAALLEVLTHHKQLWNDARSSAELDKFKQALNTGAPSTPVRKRSRSRSGSAIKTSPKARKNKQRRARQKATLQRAKVALAAQKGNSSEAPKQAARDERVPAKEWQRLISFKYSGPKRCPFYNCSLGCHWLLDPAEPSDGPQTKSRSDRRGEAALAVSAFQWSPPHFRPEVLPESGPFFLELFAGKAGISDAVRLAGVQALPPVDIVLSESVPVSVDVVDLTMWHRIMFVLKLGIVLFLHCGTPCNTFTSARKLDGDPPPLRSAAEPLGLPSLSADNEALVMLVRQLIHETRALGLDFDQCAFGAPSLKPTRLLCSTDLLDDVCMHCPGGHQHVKLKGKVWDPVQQRMVFRTKQAQVYPWALCATVATAVSELLTNPLAHFFASFQLQTPAGDRKRALGSSKQWPGHRQAESAAKAQLAGYQLKRGAAKPLLEFEMEPGEAIRVALQVVHPFTAEVMLPEASAQALAQLQRPAAVVLAERQRLLAFWKQRALELLPRSIARIRQQPDPALRRLLLGCHDHEAPQLGQVCHVELYAEMLAACNSVDHDLPQHLLHGFPIVGPIAATGRWPPYSKPQKDLPVQAALDRAWALRRKIVSRVKGVPVSENLKKIWQASIEDVEEGSCLGPFSSEAQVSECLGCEDWIPTQRFEVVQKNKVRGCDSATTNMINQVTKITEKLQLPSTDMNVAVLRLLRKVAPDEAILGWVLDERKAYRQVAVRPDHRKFSVICLKDPTSGLPSFFVMVGHSFGLVSAVYNYNRRSAAINEFLVSIFGLVAFSFYDDKYGFEPATTAGCAREVAEKVHEWLGARFDQKKLQLSSAPTILGVTYNLEAMQLEIKKERREEISSEIDAILLSGLLDPGSAGKLKGKLMFGASQLWGKVGRAFLRVISERQYLRFPIKNEFKLDAPLTEALKQWKKLVNEGPPRPIEMACSKPADLVIFTDGFTPDPRPSETLPDGVGAVMFDRRLRQPVQFSATVPVEIKKRWLQRTTQIVPVEMIATVLALETFAERVRGADVILLIDSEAVEGSLVKGYSSRDDLCRIISLFWDLAFQLRVRIFIHRVSTDANPADWPSRDKLFLGEAVGWRTVQASWPSSLFE
ncbi:unnamed protein product, partial [Cladocopium goreaui]